MALLLKATADDHDHWRERLVDTIPTTTYEGPDPSYRNRGFVLVLMAHQAVYDLRTKALEFHMAQTQSIEAQLSELFGDEEDGESESESVEDLTDGGPASTPLVGELYLDYHAYQRFAEQIVGVDLETWLAVHPDGETVTTMIEELLEAFPAYLEFARETFTAPSEAEFDSSKPGLPEEYPDDPLDRLALVWYTTLVESFDDERERFTRKVGHLGL